MLTKKPSALVYNWSKLGVFNMRTSLYDIEHLWDDVVVYSLPFTGNHIEDYARYKPDLIVSFEEDLKLGIFILTIYCGNQLTLLIEYYKNR